MRDEMIRRIACRLICALWLACVLCFLFAVAVVVLRDRQLLWDSWQRRQQLIPTFWQTDALQVATEMVTALWFFVLGGCLGSFLNVVVYRLPRGMTLLGSSQCPYCCATIRSRDNIPIWGWIARGGRCFRCWLPIAVRYPLVELAMALIVLVLAIGDVALQGVTLTGHWDPHRLGFSRTLFEMDVVNTTRLAVHGLLIFALLGGHLIEWDGDQPPASLLIVTILATFALVALVPSAGPASWAGDASALPAEFSRWHAMLQSVMGAITGLVWGILILALSPSTIPAPGSLLLPITIGTSLGWRAGLVAMILAGALAIWPVGGRRPGGTAEPPIPSRCYLAVILILWLTWAAWPALVQGLAAAA